MTATEYVCECVHMCELLSLHLVQFSNSSLDLNLTDLQLDSDSLLFFQKVWKVWGFQKVLKKELYLITEGVQSPIIKKKKLFPKHATQTGVLFIPLYSIGWMHYEPNINTATEVFISTMSLYDKDSLFIRFFWLHKF